ncbi:MAG: hypothetical protein MUF72_05165 [Elainella sp. Prado103]|jgi:hypothetical protein|nr:hypothetical protein [Elainella sp. Prado103]
MAFVRLGTLDGGNSAQNAKRLGTFNRTVSRSFGGFFSGGERVEWFQFRTDGSRFNRSSLLLAASSDSAKVEVFLKPDSGQGRKRIGQLTLAGDPRSFTTRTRNEGTYLIKIVPLLGQPAYGIAFTISGLGRSNATSATSQSAVQNQRHLFF